MKKTTIKRIIIVALILVTVGGGYATYLYNMPHRDVQSVTPFVEIHADDLIKEFLNNSKVANAKYLSADGDSKVVVVKGTVGKIMEDLKGQKVIILRSTSSKIGVSSTFTKETNKSTEGVTIGDIIKIKGVIRSGAEYDEDLELYEDVIIEKSNRVG